MRKVKPITVTYKYIGDESPEKKKLSEEAVKRVYDRIFRIAMENISERKSTKRKKQFSDPQQR